MDNKDFRQHAHELVDWMADYFENIKDYPVKSQVSPGEIYSQIPDSAPKEGQTFQQIFSDFEKIIMPGMSHWQHPNFYAYFPANSSYPSILGEMLTATLAAQCMIWDTSPAGTELEEKVMQWLIKMTGLPENLNGVIQDSASSSTLTAIITAREKYSNFEINENGIDNNRKFKIYCSTETHSSIEKAVKIAGLGKNNLVKIKVDNEQRMDPEELSKAIEKDISQGNRPLCVIATVGTTGTLAIDPLDKIAVITKKHDIWLHVDAAYAGTALILPEFRWMIKGIEHADSLVFNPHKWMFTNFDCSAYFVKEKSALIRTFEIMPEYLKTDSASQVNNYRDWSIQLGRRFRALKLWFVIRSFGIRGLQDKIKKQIDIAKNLEEKIQNHQDFEIMVQTPLNAVFFRYHPQDVTDNDLDKLNAKLLQQLDNSGKLYVTHTKINGKYIIRMIIGQTSVTEQDVLSSWEFIQKTASGINT